MRTSIIIFAFTLMATSLFGQVKKGDYFFENFEYGLALQAYEWAYHEKNVQTPFLSRKIAHTHRMLGNVAQSREWFKKTLHRDQSSPIDMLYYAEALKDSQEYDEAMKWYKKYNEKLPDDRRAIHHLEDEDYLDRLHMDSAFWEVKLLAMNSTKPEFGITQYEGDYLISYVNVLNPELGAKYHKSQKESDMYMDVYRFSRQDDNELVIQDYVDGEVNSPFHDGPVCYNPTHKELFVTRNNVAKGKPVLDEQGKVNLKLYICYQQNGVFGTANELPFNSNDFSNAHPAISQDGNTLYFASNRPGGYGETDIYLSRRTPEGWSEPENAGSTINTEGEESFPYVGPDGKLYFASTGHAGLGGTDIFKTNFEDGFWTRPENLGFGVNSSKDDFGILIDPDGYSGYLSSNRGGQGIDDDIYYFEYDPTAYVHVKVEDEGTLLGLDGAIAQLYDGDGNLIFETTTDKDGFANLKFIPEKCRYRLVVSNGREYSKQNVDIDHCTRRLKNYDLGTLQIGQLTYLAQGTVLRKSDMTPIEGFHATLYNASTGDKIRELDTKDDGQVKFNLTWDTDYKLTFQKDGWFAKSAAFTTKGMEPGIIEIERYVDLVFEEIVIQKAIKLENIHYDYNKFTIREDAKPELDKVVAMMTDNPTVRIELSSHTDSRGGDKYNLSLSDARAKAAASYIVNMGIEASRIKGKGYGENMLVNGCKNDVECSEDDHQDNRRTEFKVLDF